MPLAGLKNNEPKSRGHGGTRAGSGRKMGMPNKLTADVKAAIMAAFTYADAPLVSAVPQVRRYVLSCILEEPTRPDVAHRR